MSDKRKLWHVLKAELDFVEKGGYRNTARVPWRPQFIFQDSPTCLNFDPSKERRSCDECALIDLVPEEKRKQKVPCRHVVLNEKGETIDHFYRYGTEAELERALTEWLKETIARLEGEVVSAKCGESSVHKAAAGK